MGDAFFVITAGNAVVEHDGAPLRELGEGDFFGEISLIDGQPRTATITATEEVSALSLRPRGVPAPGRGAPVGPAGAADGAHRTTAQGGAQPDGLIPPAPARPLRWGHGRAARHAACVCRHRPGGAGGGRPQQAGDDHPAGPGVPADRHAGRGSGSHARTGAGDDHQSRAACDRPRQPLHPAACLRLLRVHRAGASGGRGGGDAAGRPAPTCACRSVAGWATARASASACHSA